MSDSSLELIDPSEVEQENSPGSTLYSPLCGSSFSDSFVCFYSAEEGHCSGDSSDGYESIKSFKPEGASVDAESYCHTSEFDFECLNDEENILVLGQGHGKKSEDNEGPSSGYMSSSLDDLESKLHSPCNMLQVIVSDTEMALKEVSSEEEIGKHDMELTTGSSMESKSRSCKVLEHVSHSYDTPGATQQIGDNLNGVLQNGSDVHCNRDSLEEPVYRVTEGRIIRTEVVLQPTEQNGSFEGDSTVHSGNTGISVSQQTNSCLSNQPNSFSESQKLHDGSDSVKCDTNYMDKVCHNSPQEKYTPCSALSGGENHQALIISTPSISQKPEKMPLSNAVGTMDQEGPLIINMQPNLRLLANLKYINITQKLLKHFVNIEQSNGSIKKEDKGTAANSSTSCHSKRKRINRSCETITGFEDKNIQSFTGMNAVENITQSAFQEKVAVHLDFENGNEMSTFSESIVRAESGSKFYTTNRYQTDDIRELNKISSWKNQSRDSFQEFRLHRSRIPLRNTRHSHGFFNWLQNIPCVRRLTRFAKVTLDNMITTLDPGMADFLDPDLSIFVVTADKKEVSTIEKAFSRAFPLFLKLDVRPVAMTSSHFPVEAFGFATGLRYAKCKVEAARSERLVPLHCAVVAVSPILVEITPLRWHSCSCVLLDDPITRLTFHVYSQTTPVPNMHVPVAEAQKEDNSRLSKLGLTFTGEAMRLVSGTPSQDWQKAMTGVSYYAMLENAVLTLAGMYKKYLEDGNGIF